MAEIRIVANCAPFRAVEEAAFAEQRVDWWDEKDAGIRACVECYAAVEIYRHFTQMCAGEWTIRLLSSQQAQLPPAGITVWVGEAAFSQAIADAYQKLLPAPAESKEGHGMVCAQVDGAFHWMIAGNSPHGTLYGAYAFLETLGVRWFGAGENDVSLPAVRDESQCIRPGYAKADAPRYKTRGVYSEFINDSRTAELLWAARMRSNFFFGANIENPHLLKKLGFRLAGGGHAIQQDYLNPHALCEDGVHTYAEAHPAYFALVEGERRFDLGDGCMGGYNFCTSNADAVEALCDNLVASLAGGKLRFVDYLNFWMQDMGTWCQCTQCAAAGNYTSRLIQVVARLREKIEESQRAGRLKREIYILFPAYLETLQPPDRPMPAGFDYEHCLPTFFPIERCYLHAINDPRCTETNADIIRAFRPWTTDADRHYRGALFLGEYFNVSPFANLPFQFTEILQHDLFYYYEAGIRHFYFFHFPVGKIGPLRWTNYLIYKLLWDPSAKAADLQAEYFRLFYEEDPEIRRVYGYLEQASRNAKYFKHYQLRSAERLSLNEKLDVLDQALFPMRHMQLDSVDAAQGGVSLFQMMDLLQQARRHMDRALMEQSGKVLDRLLEDDSRLRYLEEMTGFLLYFSLAALAYSAGKTAQAHGYYRWAALYAEELKKRTDCAVNDIDFELYRNAFKASWCAAGFQKLGELLEGPAAQDAP